MGSRPGGDRGDDDLQDDQHERDAQHAVREPRGRLVPDDADADAKEKDALLGSRFRDRAARRDGLERHDRRARVVERVRLRGRHASRARDRAARVSPGQVALALRRAASRAARARASVGASTCVRSARAWKRGKQASHTKFVEGLIMNGPPSLCGGSYFTSLPFSNPQLAETRAQLAWSLCRPRARVRARGRESRTAIAATSPPQPDVSNRAATIKYPALVLRISKR